LELRFDLCDARLETPLGPVEIEQAEVGGRTLLRLKSNSLAVGNRRHSLSALIERQDGALGFATFAVSAATGGSLPRARFAEVEQELLEIAREWALENSSI
jgi:hypothetical protein